ncbi:MAG: Omp28-related outer membrane protein [Bacteroidales bacterium]|nr:Omp28-related outer membrane protein [Bacteroidales bacterium]
MKSIVKFLLPVLMLLPFYACSGNLDDEGDAAEYGVPEGVLRIFADKTEIAADGVEKVTFTVVYGSSDVSDMSGMVISHERGGVVTELPEGKHEFTSTAPGEYVFTATYDYGGKKHTDNSVKVTVRSSGNQMSSGYRQKMIAMQFTSVGCVNCPILAEALKNVQKNYPDMIIPVAFHLDYDVEDPMTLSMNSRFYSRLSDKDDHSLGLPMFAFNFRKSSQPIINEYAKIVSEMELQAELYPPVCGVAVETSYDEGSGKVQIDAKFRSDVAMDARYHIFLLEDGYEYYQAGFDGDEYVHDNVLRYISSDNVLGSKIEQGKVLEPGREYVVSKSVTLDGSWNASKMRVVVAMLCSYDGGETYCSNNANECSIGESADYSYED